MKRILLLLEFDLCLLISPFGGADLFIPATKAVAQKTYHAAVNIGHTSVSAVKSSIERTANQEICRRGGKIMETHPNIGDGNMRPNFPGRYRKHTGTSTSELTARSRGMKRIPLALLLLLFLPTAATPQRYGRPYTLASIPQLLLQVSVQKKTHYFSVYELRKMPRSIVTETDPTTNQTHVYEGVALGKLVPTAGLPSAGEIVEIEYGSHQRQTIPGTALDTLTELIVVDTLDGKPLTADGPYSLIAKFPLKPALRISGVHCVAVKTS